MANRFETALKGKGADIINIGKPQQEIITVEEEILATNEMEEENSSGTIVIKQRKKVKTKEYANFYLQIKTINMIDKYSSKSGMNKSELVDTLLNEAFSRLKIK